MKYRRIIRYEGDGIEGSKPPQNSLYIVTANYEFISDHCQVLTISVVTGEYDRRCRTGEEEFMLQETANSLNEAIEISEKIDYELKTQDFAPGRVNL